MQLNETEVLFKQAAKKAQEAFSNCITLDDLTNVWSEWNSFKTEFKKVYPITSAMDEIDYEVRTARAYQHNNIACLTKRKQLEDIFSNFYGNIAKWIDNSSNN